MRRALAPRVTAGIALTGAGLVAVTPVAPPQADVQQRLVQFTSYDEFDLSQLTSTTEANLGALETYFSSNPFTTAPDVAQGLSTVLSDLTTNTPNPVTNPISLLTEGALVLLGANYASNAASTALTGVSDNIYAALSSGDYSAALTDLEKAPTTVLYALLNGYPQTIGSELISPQLGLLTSPNGSDVATGSIYAVNQLQTTLADELSAAGGGNLTTAPTLLGPGTLDVANVDTLLNDLAPSGTLTLPFSLDQLLSDAAPGGTLTLPVSLDQLLSDAAPGGTVTLPVSLDQLLSDAATNGYVSVPISIDSLLNDSGLASISIPIHISFINTGVNIPISTVESLLGGVGSSHLDVPVSTLESVLGSFGSQDLSVSTSTLEDLLGTAGSSHISLSVSTLEDLLGTVGSSQISLSVSTLESALPSTLNLNLTITEVTGVPNYDVALSQDLLAVLGSIAPVSSDLPTMLTTDPTLDLTSLLTGVAGDLSLPISIVGGDLSANLTGIGAELLAGLIP